MHIHTQESGEGPILVMLHGLFGDSDNFNGIAKLLAPQFRILQIDLPAHGRSDSLPKITIEAMADALITHFTDNNLSKFNLLGHSLGGKVAMCIASRVQSPEIARLLIADIAPRQYPPHHQTILAALNALDLNTIENRKQADEHLSQYISEPSVRGFLLKSLSRNDAKSNSTEPNYRWRFDLNRLYQGYDAIRQIPTFDSKIKCPALFIKAEHSDYIDATDEPAIRQHFEQASFKMISNTGHWLHAEKPEQFARICSNFLNT